MKIKQDFTYFNDNLAIQIHGLLPPQQCKELMSRYENSLDKDLSDETLDGIFKECRDLVFIDDVDALLTNYFQSEYQPHWPRYDVVDSSASIYNGSCLWHLDHGMPNMLKLFVYLNPVTQHGGNTLFFDRNRTVKLRNAGELPIENNQRKEDLTQALEEMGLDSCYLAFDLKAGDALLFSPLLLAHRCLAPRAGKKRHTICFTITPPI